jgi:hypothetical protein
MDWIGLEAVLWCCVGAFVLAAVRTMPVKPRLLPLAAALLLAAVFGMSSPGAAAGRFVKVTSPTSLRTSASDKSSSVGRAAVGDVFELEEERGGWYEVDGFGLESAFIRASAAKETDGPPPLLISENTKRAMCFEVVRAQDRAERDAIARYPTDRFQLTYEQRLYTTYELPIFHRYGVAPANKDKLAVECAKNHWLPPRK